MISWRAVTDLGDDDYARLSALRTGLRRFDRWSAQQAEAAGLTPTQHQLLLAIRGHGNPLGPTVGDIADHLLLQHHSAVGLIDRAEAAGLVYRSREDDDRRVVRLHLTDNGAERLRALSIVHLEELDRLALELPDAWQRLAPSRAPRGFAPPPGPPHALTVEVARVYDPNPPRSDQYRVLVDRLWPRGISRADPPFNTWMKDVAPSNDLRRWYGHTPDRFKKFSQRYREELSRPPALGALQLLQAAAQRGSLVLMTATKELSRSNAAVLAATLQEDPGHAGTLPDGAADPGANT
jgi:uncharacterized protein YeaO (DUF488 family)/DNA-binding MarR family transcriptional regulator